MITNIANGIKDLKNSNIQQLLYYLNSYGHKFNDLNDLINIVVNQIDDIHTQINNNFKVCNNYVKSNNNNNI